MRNKGCLCFGAGSTALHDASCQGLYTVVDRLLDKGAFVVITDAQGYTPLQV